MENATKALLIAAAVLIAIVLVALGVNLLNAGSDTSDEAGEVANKIGESIGTGKNTVKDALGDIDILN